MPMPNLPALINAKLQAAGNTLGYRSCTLGKVASGTRTPGNISGGTNPTTTNYQAVGAVSEYDAAEIDGTIITVHDRKITLLAASLPRGVYPEPADLITISDQTGTSTTYRIAAKGVDASQSGTKFVCQVRA